MSIEVAVAADERYLLPLAVVLRSALDHLEYGADLRVHVLHDRLGEDARRSVESQFATDPVALHWLSVDGEALARGVPLAGYSGVPSTYFRLAMEEVLPATTQRLIYLDLDLLCLANLADLWREDLDGNAALAVRIRPPLEVMLGFSPAELSESLGLPAFNSGVLLLDLDLWRSEGIGRRALQLARTYHDRFRHWDQDALNLALVGRWAPLHPRWNWRPDAFGFPAWNDVNPFRPGGDGGVIIHYAGADKPWHPVSDHPTRERYFDYVDRTSWRGWRPPRLRPVQRLRERWLARPHRQLDRLGEIIGKARATGRPYRRYVGLAACVIARRPWLLVSYPALRRRGRQRGHPPAEPSRPG